MLLTKVVSSCESSLLPATAVAPIATPINISRHMLNCHNSICQSSFLLTSHAQTVHRFHSRWKLQESCSGTNKVFPVFEVFLCFCFNKSNLSAGCRKRQFHTPQQHPLTTLQQSKNVVKYLWKAKDAQSWALVASCLPCAVVLCEPPGMRSPDGCKSRGAAREPIYRADLRDHWFAGLIASALSQIAARGTHVNVFSSLVALPCFTDHLCEQEKPQMGHA